MDLEKRCSKCDGLLNSYLTKEQRKREAQQCVCDCDIHGLSGMAIKLGISRELLSYWATAPYSLFHMKQTVGQAIKFHTQTDSLRAGYELVLREAETGKIKRQKNLLRGSKKITDVSSGTLTTIFH